MSTAEKYVHSLKQIKEAEDKVQLQLEEHKKKVAEEIRSFENTVSKTIADAKTTGEILVETGIEQSRNKAKVETENIINEATLKSKTISAKVDAKAVREIIDNLIKEV